jgi:hypothetical protein
MNNENLSDSVLQWRLARAGRGAPPPPNSARLIEQLRPWWEIWPEKLTALRGQLVNLRVTFGHAAVNAPPSCGSVPVPTVFVHDNKQTGTLAKIVFLSVRGLTLRMRFQIDALPSDATGNLELTILSDQSSRPLVAAEANPVGSGEYRAEVELPPDLAEQWASLKMSERMPFGLILFAKNQRLVVAERQ